MEFSLKEKEQLQEMVTGFAKMLRTIEENRTSLQRMLRQLPEDKANEMKAVIFRLNQADEDVRSAKGRLAQISQ